MSNDQLDVATLDFVAKGLNLRADLVEQAAAEDLLLLDSKDADAVVRTLRVMSSHYSRMAKRVESEKLALQPSTVVPATYDPNGNEADDIAYALGSSRLSLAQLTTTLVEAGTPWCARHNTPRVLIARILEQLAGPGKRFLESSTGKYYVNPRRVPTAKTTVPAHDLFAKKRPRDFMAQAVSNVLGRQRAGDAEPLQLHTDTILKRIISTPGNNALLERVPTKPQIADTLSAGSRGPNPRFIRVKPGLYQNNPKYKKAKR